MPATQAEGAAYVLPGGQVSPGAFLTDTSGSDTTLDLSQKAEKPSPAGQSWNMCHP
jgi:hypothetical protein